MLLQLIVLPARLLYFDLQLPAFGRFLAVSDPPVRTAHDA
jgi:hypothetical protein